MPNLSEFELINKYFTYRSEQRDDVIMGVGDDAAVLHVPKGKD